MISTLGTAEVAVSLGIVVSVAVIVVPVVVEGRGEWRCRELRGGQLEVAEKGKILT